MQNYQIPPKFPTYLEDVLLKIINKIESELRALVQTHFYHDFQDESKIAFWSFVIPKPYSNGADPEGELNAEVSQKFMEDVTKLFKDRFDKSINTKKSEHFLISSSRESIEVHFNDSTLNIIYHYTGQW